MNEEIITINESPFTFTSEQLAELVDPKNPEELLRLGGINGIANGLNVNLEKGISLKNKTKKDINDKTEKSEENVLECEDEIELNNRIKFYGRNILPETKSVTIFQLMWMAMHDNIMILLTIAALISLSIGLFEEFSEEGMQYSWIEGLSIILAVFIVIFVGSVNDFQKEKQFRALNAKKEDRNVKVLRNGEREMISIYDVVVGDILVLEPGDILCADGIYIDGHNLKCDESAATGESDTIKKNSTSEPFLISGSKVVEGVGECLVIAVGCNSFHGKTMMSLRIKDEETPLQVKLNDLAEYIAKIGTAAAILMFVALLFKYILVSTQNGFEDVSEIFSKITEIFISAITIVVVAVPEGLPLAVTLALAFATTRMLKDNNLVRVLNACETMGGATTICSDKTGTLTQNKMTVVKGVIGKNIKFEDIESIRNMPKTLESIENTPESQPNGQTKNNSSGSESESSLSNALNGRQVMSILYEGVSINSSAFEGKTSEGATEFIGSKTETALLEMIQNMGLDYKEVRNNSKISVEQIYPFSSEKKNMATIIKIDQSDKGKEPIYRVHVKGASEIVLNYCSKIISLSSSSNQSTILKMNQSIYDNITNNIINRFADESLRTICIAYRDFTLSEYMKIVNEYLRKKVNEANTKDKIEEWKRMQAEKIALEKGISLEEKFIEEIMNSLNNEDIPLDELNLDEELSISEIISHPLAHEELACSNLTCVGIVGIEDPVRPGVPEAVTACQKAGVVVRMVTGDNINTARAIASKCGIYTPGGIIMEGSNFRKLSNEEMKKVVPNLQVLARSSPTDKQLLVGHLKEMNETVAVTGDGTNDGPALKMADVGFSMGIAGTEVAKEASSIILMDDNFSSIVKAILWGRSVNDSVKKFLQFQLTVNITAVIITFISAMVDGEEGSALNAIQLLWVNLIMDTLAALALATESPTPDLLDRPPQGKSSPLISPAMWKMILGQAIFQILVNVILLFKGPDIFKNEMKNLKLIGGVTNSARVYCLDNPKSLECIDTDFFIDKVEEERVLLKTIVFNTFVLMQLFNEINCRRIDNKLNVFKGIFNNAYFVTIFIGIAIVQVIIIFFGASIFKTTPLDFKQWIVCVAIGLMSIPLAIPIRLLPDEIVNVIFMCFPTHKKKVEQTSTVTSSAASTHKTFISEKSTNETNEEKSGGGGSSGSFSRALTDSSNITYSTVSTTQSSFLRTLHGGRLNAELNEDRYSQKNVTSLFLNRRNNSGRIMTSPTTPNYETSAAREAWNRAFKKVQQQKFSMSS